MLLSENKVITQPTRHPTKTCGLQWPSFGPTAPSKAGAEMPGQAWGQSSRNGT